jgi:preprotein translocase subunit SecE
METNTVAVQETAPPSGPTGWLATAKEYVEGLQAEMRKVTWPTRDQVIATTGVVIASVLLFAAYFALVDFLINKGIDKVFELFKK